MRILFDNAAKRATISSLNESANYPAENLVDEFLQLRWQENLSGSVITVEFDNPEDVNCVFWSYSNANGIIVETNTGEVAYERPVGYETTIPLGEDIETILGEYIGIIPARINAGCVYFNSLQSDVTHLYIYIFGEVDKTYLGGIGCGVYYQMPRPNVNHSEGFQDNSIESSSLYGQSLQNYITPMYKEQYTFSGILREERTEIMELYKTIGLGGKVWVDFNEFNHEFKEPMYAKFAAVPESTRNGNSYTLGMSFMEAR